MDIVIFILAILFLMGRNVGTGLAICVIIYSILHWIIAIAEEMR